MKMRRIFLESERSPQGSVDKFNAYDLDLDQMTFINNSWIVTILSVQEDYPIPRPQQGASSKTEALNKVIEYYQVEAKKLGLSFRTADLPEVK
jgi:hypothetical protein